MSFAGFGPLGALGWGTPLVEALDQQARLVIAKFERLQQIIRAPKQSEDTAISHPSTFADGALAFPPLSWSSPQYKLQTAEPHQ